MKILILGLVILVHHEAHAGYPYFQQGSRPNIKAFSPFDPGHVLPPAPARFSGRSLTSNDDEETYLQAPQPDKEIVQVAATQEESGQVNTGVEDSAGVSPTEALEQTIPSETLEKIIPTEPLEQPIPIEALEKIIPIEHLETINSGGFGDLILGVDEFPPQFTKFPSQPARPFDRFFPPNPFGYYGSQNPPVSQVTYHTTRYMPQVPYTGRNSYEVEYDRLTDGEGTYQTTSLAELATTILKHSTNIKRAIIGVLKSLAEDITGDSAYKLCGYGKVQLSISQAVSKFSNGLSDFISLDAGFDYGDLRRKAYKTFRSLQDSLQDALNSIDKEYKTANEEPTKHIKEIDVLIEQGISQLTYKAPK